ncbi:MAG: hypothetical protein ACM37W_12300 [Actinomycetota bacterium]
MSSEQLEIAQKEYQVGRTHFERGQYGQAVKHLQAASALIDRNSRLGGEVQMWLVTAYEAAGQNPEAIALCKQLSRHPRYETRQQAKRLLYILEAPKLSTRPEWLVKIPDLAALEDNEASILKPGAGDVVKRPPKKPTAPPPIDLSQVNTKDNRFLWVALLGTVLAVAGLIYFS